MREKRDERKREERRKKGLALVQVFHQSHQQVWQD
jgi:hypothetical protein